MVDWSVRVKAIDALSSIAHAHAPFLMQSKYFQKFIDHFLKLVRDQNSKVAIHGIERLNALVETLKVHPVFSTAFRRSLTWFAMPFSIKLGPWMPIFAPKRSIYWTRFKKKRTSKISSGACCKACSMQIWSHVMQSYPRRWVRRSLDYLQQKSIVN